MMMMKWIYIAYAWRLFRLINTKNHDNVCMDSEPGKLSIDTLHLNKIQINQSLEKILHLW